MFPIRDMLCISEFFERHRMRRCSNSGVAGELSIAWPSGTLHSSLAPTTARDRCNMVRDPHLPGEDHVVAGTA